MKIIPLNKLDQKIIKISQKINSQYFKGLDVSVGLFQSQNYDGLYCISLSVKAPSFVIPKEDSNVLSCKFKEVREIINYFSENVKTIIWFGKTTQKRGMADLNHLVTHELKHIEQRITNLSSHNKDRVLDCFFYGSSQKKKTPAEKDADNFANMVIGKSYDNAYSWTKETNQLFNENEDVIKQLYRKIKENGDEILFDDTVFLANKEERKLFCHFYEKAYRT